MNTLLTEQCPKITINTFLDIVKKKLKVELLEVEIKSAGWDIDLVSSSTANGGKRIWFSCPLCESRVGVLYTHPISQLLGCRKCLNLDYSSRRYRGMLEQSMTK